MSEETDGKKSVLIVGASASIGQAVIEAFLRRQARILCTYRSRPISVASSALAECRLDITDEESVALFCNDTLPKFGSLDVVVVLSGMILGRSLREYEPDLINLVMDVNFIGVAKLLMNILPILADPSHIILMASIAAERGSYDPIYAASKGALISFAKSVATWHAPQVRVNIIAPGLIDDSSMAREMTAERRAQHLANSPMEALLSKNDLGEIIADLSEDHWKHLNGAVIRLNGGDYV